MILQNMKKAIIFGLLVFLVWGTAKVVKTQSLENTKLEIQLSFPKTSYMTGEVVNLNFEVKNKTNKILTVRNSLTSEAGYLHLFISKETDKNFKEFIGAGRGQSDMVYKNVNIKPDGSLSHMEIMYWNAKPNISDSIAPDVIERASKEKILNDYAFSEPGVYYVKATCWIHFITQSNPILFESKPIKITITEPEGDELEVWNKIKDNGDFAYFIQEGDMLIPSYKPEERAKFQTEIEQILADYPNSFYAVSLSQSLSKFKASEAKRKEFIEKHKQPE
jgi:hypothetical protein